MVIMPSLNRTMALCCTPRTFQITTTAIKEVIASLAPRLNLKIMNLIRTMCKLARDLLKNGKRSSQRIKLMIAKNRPLARIEMTCKYLRCSLERAGMS